MSTKSDSLKVIDPLNIDGNKEQLDEMPIVPDDSVQKKTGDRPGHF